MNEDWGDLRMTRLWSKFLAGILAVALILSAMPLMAGPASTAYAAATYGKTVKDKVNFRLSPGGDRIFYLPIGWVFEVTDQKVSGGDLWYKGISKNAEDTSNTRTYTGYVKGDSVALLTEEEAKAWEENPKQDLTPGGTAVPGVAMGEIVGSGVNFREGPSLKSTSLFKVDKGIRMEILEQPAVGSTDPWYKVKYNGYTGYIQGPYMKVIGPVAPTTAPTVTPAPTTPSVSSYGYIKTTVGAVNFRRTTGGPVVTRIDRNKPFAVTGPTLRVGGYTWYPMVYQGMNGYLRSDVVATISKEEFDKLSGDVPAVTPTPTPADPSAPTAAPTSAPTPVTPTVDPSNYIITVKTGVFLRAGAGTDQAARAQVKMGTILETTGTTTKAGKLWYRIKYEGKTLFVMGTCVRQATAQDLIDAGITPTSGPVSAQGYVKTTVGGVNVRSKANGSNIIGRIKDKGTVLQYYSTQVVGKYTWYQVQTEFGWGYVTGQYVQVVTDPSGSGTPTPAPSTSPEPGPTVYPTLRLGDTGDEVKKLTTALKEQGYFTGAVTSTYTTAVRDAVKKFQQYNSLTVDGVAGPITLSTLYSGGGKVDPSDVTITLYTAEKIDWFTGGINELWARGDNYKIYDVYTGKVWWAHRWAGGSHADIEPLTASDTATLCKIYGVTKASDIASKNLWQRRPCLVTIGKRTFACSLYGIPHGTQTIYNNNYPGQACLHFTNSKTHDSKRVDTYHQNAIQYAWEHAPNGHK